MAFKIISKEEKPLLSRTEYTAGIHEEKTPSYAELKKIISAHIKKDESLIVINRVDQKFGIYDMNVNFYAYDNESAFKQFVKVKAKKAAK